MPKKELKIRTEPLNYKCTTCKDFHKYGTGCYPEKKPAQYTSDFGDACSCGTDVADFFETGLDEDEIMMYQCPECHRTWYDERDL